MATGTLAFVLFRADTWRDPWPLYAALRDTREVSLHGRVPFVAAA
jgi:hypothetical protein